MTSRRIAEIPVWQVLRDAERSVSCAELSRKQLAAEAEALAAQKEALAEEGRQLTLERDDLIQENDRMLADKEEIEVERDALASERYPPGHHWIHWPVTHCLLSTMMLRL